ncbi:MAG: cytochrome [Rhodospirillaceae bacterium]|nr:MAG: cytochrome [Rhodospirillaceae bacterium]TNC96633.1 MAG: cytochrome b561 [Stygiobacter sp.]
MNIPSRYDALAMSLHWIMALLIIGLWCLGLVLEDLPKGDLRGQMFGLHKAFGTIVLILAATRLTWRLTHSAPPLPDGMPGLERLAAKAGHAALYLLMIALPLDGILMSQTGGREVSVFGWVAPTLMGKNDFWHEVFEDGHGLLAWALAAILVGHVLAALRHHFVVKDDVLARMLPGGK